MGFDTLANVRMMSLQVKTQVVRSRVHFVADKAGEPLLPRMPSEVILEFRFPDEAFFANRALVGPLPGVNCQVKVEFVPPTELFLARRAGEPLHVVVYLHVTPETRGRNESVAADLTQERLEQIVETGLVVGEINFLDEPLAALVAFV